MLSKDRRPAEKFNFDKTLAKFTGSQDVDVPAKQGFHSSTSLKSSRDPRAFGFNKKELFSGTSLALVLR